ncbi:hypothetical protein K1719_008716 [Acacia pycnantha]|nr:hypothetical protein K1719_008716 [Acacia pycnantha]
MALSNNSTLLFLVFIVCIGFGRDNGSEYFPKKPFTSIICYKPECKFLGTSIQIQQHSSQEKVSEIQS